MTSHFEDIEDFESRHVTQGKRKDPVYVSPEKRAQLRQDWPALMVEFRDRPWAQPGWMLRGCPHPARSRTA
jgi:hypothetical protein